MAEDTGGDTPSLEDLVGQLTQTVAVLAQRQESQDARVAEADATVIKGQLQQLGHPGLDVEVVKDWTGEAQPSITKIAEAFTEKGLTFLTGGQPQAQAGAAMPVMIQPAQPGMPVGGQQVMPQVMPQQPMVAGAGQVAPSGLPMYQPAQQFNPANPYGMQPAAVPQPALPPDQYPAAFMGGADPALQNVFAQTASLYPQGTPQHTQMQQVQAAVANPQSPEHLQAALQAGGLASQPDRGGF